MGVPRRHRFVMEERYSQGLVTVGVCSIPAANLRIEQVQILVLSLHLEQKKKNVTKLVPGMDPKHVSNALRNTCQSNAINCQEHRAGIAVQKSSKKMHTAKSFIQWDWKLWSVSRETSLMDVSPAFAP